MIRWVMDGNASKFDLSSNSDGVTDGKDSKCNLLSDGVTDGNTSKGNVLSDATRCPLTAMTEGIRLMTASWQAGPNNMTFHFTPGTSFVS
jgi:hypothetical protein